MNRTCRSYRVELDVLGQTRTIMLILQNLIIVNYSTDMYLMDNIDIQAAALSLLDASFAMCLSPSGFSPIPLK